MLNPVGFENFFDARGSMEQDIRALGAKLPDA